MSEPLLRKLNAVLLQFTATSSQPPKFSPLLPPPTTTKRWRSRRISQWPQSDLVKVGVVDSVAAAVRTAPEVARAAPSVPNSSSNVVLSKKKCNS